MTDDRIEAYKKSVHAPIKLIFYLLLALIALALVSLSASEIKIGIMDSFRILYRHICGYELVGYGDVIRDRIIVQQNLPREFGAIAAGIILAVSGAVLQNVIRNPLADPYTLGISSGALFGMVLSVVLGFSVISIVGVLDGRILNAFIFALIPTGVVVVVSAFKKVTPTMMILCGIAVMYIFNAFTTIMKYTTDNETLTMIYHWSVGSVSGLSWGAMPKLLFAVLLVCIPLYYLREQIDILAQGDNCAITLGINPNKLRLISLILVSVSSAIIVCYTGTIGFVGLVAPHIARTFFGSKCRLLIPASAVIGAIMVLGADYIVRLLAPNLPVGVVLSLVCSPIFIFILIKMKRNVW